LATKAIKTLTIVQAKRGEPYKARKSEFENFGSNTVVLDTCIDSIMMKITTAAAIVLSVVAAFALNEMLEFGVDRLQFATGLATILVAVAGLAAVLQEREEEASPQSQHLNGKATPSSKLLF
jgi:hypothetical protein